VLRIGVHIAGYACKHFIRNGVTISTNHKPRVTIRLQERLTHCKSLNKAVLQSLKKTLSILLIEYATNIVK